MTGRRIFIFLVMLLGILQAPAQTENNAVAGKSAENKAIEKKAANEKAGVEKTDQSATKAESEGLGVEGVTGKPGDAVPMMPEADPVSFVKSLMALTFVLGLIFLTAYLFKKFTGMKGAGFRGNLVPINLVGNFPLGDKKFLAVVEISGKMFFIGITSTSINMLSPLDIPVPNISDAAPDGDGNFENVFKKARTLLQQRGGK